MVWQWQKGTLEISPLPLAGFFIFAYRTGYYAETFRHRCGARSSKPVAGFTVCGRFDPYTSPPNAAFAVIGLIQAKPRKAVWPIRFIPFIFIIHPRDHHPFEPLLKGVFFCSLPDACPGHYRLPASHFFLIFQAPLP